MCPAIKDQPMMEDESCFEGVEVGDVVQLNPGNLVPKVQFGAGRGGFLFCSFPVGYIVLLCHFNPHQILGDNLADQGAFFTQFSSSFVEILRECIPSFEDVRCYLCCGVVSEVRAQLSLANGGFFG